MHPQPRNRVALVSAQRDPGQIFDRETGLAYNRFRYYDPALRCYTQPDPIGLVGGLHPQNYVPDPTGWIDPFGLNCGDDAAELRRRMVQAGRTEPPYPNSAHHIVQSNATDPVSEASRKHLQDHGIDINDPDNGVFLPTSSADRNAARATPAPHSRAHTNEVRQHVHDRITSKTTEADIRSEVQAIRDEFLSGIVPGRTDYTPPPYP